jgi:O6-methylguanine-DNA--protein-cysteine methyltransferase
LARNAFWEITPVKVAVTAESDRSGGSAVRAVIGVSRGRSAWVAIYTEVVRQLSLDSLRLAVSCSFADRQGTEFQPAALPRLQEIRYGETISFGEVAKRVGNPKASRAVGGADGQNPIRFRP